MIVQTLPGLALRQAECAPLASLSQNHLRSGDWLGIHIDQRLPPISDLLRDVPPPPPPPALSRPSVVSPWMTLPTPVASSPSPTGFPTTYPTWSALPPRPRSVPGQYAGFLPPSPPSLVPRRASADCPNATPRSFSVPGRPVAAHHHQPTSPDHERDRRQRRSTKQHTRRWRGDSSSPSFSPNPSLSSPDSDSPDTAPAVKPIRAADKSAVQRKHHHQHLQHPHQQHHQQQQKGKRNNTPYTFEQEAFFIYHRIDLDLSWEQVRRAYMARWPSIERTVSGLECSYYRTNGHLPETTPDGLLVLVAPEAAAAAAAAAAAGDGQLTPPATPDLVERREGGRTAGRDQSRGSDDDEDEEGKKKKKDPGYMWYRGAAYRTKSIKCRKARISLLERFPEELVDEANDWVREEHRVLARGVGEWSPWIRRHFCCLFLLGDG
ncbi:hypothetical protein C8A05DRAFT_11911 [Staphylotrichum tortipilum]|uniref:Uncharacterized protein n=1 Tax=Staphylotrichum tortipilum TaxID=2831512 RepID=A0AAN6MSI1_9PEZI|nr:hypothetical protein C8A05DRAFT_11911 [Staphylotrichum longicolle]